MVLYSHRLRRKEPCATSWGIPRASSTWLGSRDTEAIPSILAMAAALEESCAHLQENMEKVTAMRDRLIAGLSRIPWRVELMAGEGQHVNVVRLHVHWHVAHSLYRVGMEQNSLLPAQRADFPHRLEGVSNVRLC